MTPISLSVVDLAAASLLIVLDAALSLLLGLGIHRQVIVAACRMVIQLLLVGLVLRFVFALNTPLLTFPVLCLMMLVAAREVAARPERRLARGRSFRIGGIVVFVSTGLTSALALTTAIRPDPVWDPRYAIPLAGIILGTVLNSASLALDSLLDGCVKARPVIEARLALGHRIEVALRPFVRQAIRRGMVPIINQMAAAGVVTLPGIMTGQILAGLDPMEAVKYQILLMFLLAGGSALAAFGVALLTVRRLTDTRGRLRIERIRGQGS